MYIAFSLFSLSACSKHDDVFTFEKQLSQKRITAANLLANFNAEMFECADKEILNKPVVLDSIILGIKKSGDDYFIKAKVKSSCEKKYFAELKCSEEIADQFNHTKSNSAYLAAKILKIDGVNMVAEADSLNGSNTELQLGNVYLLTGECLALAEIPPIVNAD